MNRLLLSLTILLQAFALMAQSKLAEGELYKIAISEDGIYQIGYDFLKQLDIDVDQLNPAHLQLLGNGAGLLPTPPNAEAPLLKEIAIEGVGMEDGQFNQSDYFLFYGQGADQWAFDENTQSFHFEKNHYDIQNHYFIKINAEEGLRIPKIDSPASATYTTESYDALYRLEEEAHNLLEDWDKTQGSGFDWLGDHFKVVRSEQYNFNIENRITEQSIHLKASMVLRAKVSSRFELTINGATDYSEYVNSVNIGSSDEANKTYAHRATLDGTYQVNGSDIQININYPYPEYQGDKSEAWLDYIQLRCRENLRWQPPFVHFRDLESIAHSSTRFNIADANTNISVWDISKPLEPKSYNTSLNGQTLTFIAHTAGTLTSYIAFDQSASYPEPISLGSVSNQDLLVSDPFDMAVVYHPDFEEAALQIADHRANHDNLSVISTPVNQIYNEFAAGSKDATAIRNFAQRLYQQSTNFKYLLLIGDGSFDARNIYELGGDFIPTYQKGNWNAITAYPTDDYYGIMEGNTPLSGPMQIAVGRLPVNTSEEASVVVNKIIQYDTAPEFMADWRNQIIFVGDDDDAEGGEDIAHFKDADDIAQLIADSFPSYNQAKIYLDAFPQESHTGGERIPQAREKINQNMYKGALLLTYLGHGGPEGWAQERVLNISDITNWNNEYKLPVFITATCTFTGYDDPSFTTAGEEVFLNPKGGAVALMTTTRPVTTGHNKTLSRRSLLKLLKREVGDHSRPIGDAYIEAKNTQNNPNSRKYTLIGDPAMKLAIPQYEVKTNAINGKEVTLSDQDTIGALQEVSISGIVTDKNGQLLSSFNGEIYPTIYDKPQIARTLAHGFNEVYPYTIQQNLIFKGRATVKNGKFEFTFIVPKDINYDYGFGKISYYAFSPDLQTDATGYYDKIIIGGTSRDAILDDEGPVVEVYMNTEDFVFGGITSSSPTLLVKLEDDYGINVVGNSIGHDLEAVLDNNTQQSYLLNAFYEAVLDDHTKGSVTYPLNELEEGKHIIRVKAWDIANNPSEGYTEFVVANTEKVALEHVLNYPNPFSDRTCFQFDHNLSGQDMEVQVHIYTVSGRLIKTIYRTMLADGSLRQDDCLEWDGRDDFGDQLARGIYLYKVKVQALNVGNEALYGESEFEKLVLLK
ncbi:MAG: type IX secretion system sortase PorU [Chitinophagales bacterium]|nr:type IX secretion system sortase PorU [Chitinophagales bacterium]